RSNVKSPWLVLTATECVLPSSRSIRFAFDLAPLISQFIELPPDALSLFLPPHPTSRTTSGRSRSRRVTRSLRARGERGPPRSRPCTPFPEAGLRLRALPGSRAPTGPAR